MADKSLIQQALELAKQGQEFVFPHASKNPYAPLAYVKDFNEWFAPAAQMAIDEAAGEEDYPAWAYGLASIPVVGKVGKVAGKVAKGAGKAAKKESWRVAIDEANKLKSHSERMAEMDKLFELGDDITNDQFMRYNQLRKMEGMPERTSSDFMREWRKAFGNADGSFNINGREGALGSPTFDKNGNWRFDMNLNDLKQKIRTNSASEEDVEMYRKLKKLKEEDEAMKNASPEWTLVKEEPLKESQIKEYKKNGSYFLEDDNGIAKYDIDDDSGEIILENLESNEKRKGTGTKLISRLKEIANDKGMNISLAAYPQDKSIGLDELVDFYKKNGFEVEYAGGVDEPYLMNWYR